MNARPLRLTTYLTTAGLLLLATAAGCGGGDSSGDEGGSGGSAGGTAGSGGTGATGGSGGSGGTAGSTGGTAGTAGSGASAGAGGLDAGPDGAAGLGGNDAGEDASIDASAGSAGGPDASSSCTGDDDCIGDPNGPHCDPTSGACVACLESDPTTCPDGTYCDPGTLDCVAGCDSQQDCDAGSDAGTLTCDPVTHQCVGCLIDDDCPLGFLCQNDTCEPGCTTQHPCPGSDSCCSGSCEDTDTSMDHCGACDQPCVLQNASASCAGGQCLLGDCDPGYDNCDQNSANGCETDVPDGGVGCACVPGETQDCYTGPPPTQDVGVCHGGTRTCNAAGSGWSPCVGEVVPGSESCYTAEDDDCDGEVNEGGIGCVCSPNASQACYTGDASTRNIGACEDGTETCNATGTAWGTCTGEVLPIAESCYTAVDDDCDGEVNEDGDGCGCTPNSVAPCYTGPAGTENVGTCVGGSQTCNGMGTGYGPCVGAVVPTADDCTDNLDNDCNGVVNDGYYAGATGCACYPSAVSTCYSGPAGTENVGVCTSGIATCNASGTAYGTCVGEVIPTTDDCNDSLDNDCNGVVNDGFTSGGQACVCVPGSQADCYDGPAGTAGVGECRSGKRTCLSNGTGYGACIGQIIPDADRCDNAVDDDCNGVVNDGYASGAPACLCVPNETVSCYSGPAGTAGVGLCHAGTRSCNALGTGWFGCVGEVTPVPEVCGNGLNDDCVGVADDGLDQDGDGFSTCSGDCCDSAGSVCGSPADVNPSAIEVQGDGVDNNCNGQTDENPLSTCSTGTSFTSDVSGTKALAMLNAMDICQVSQNGSWGIVPGSYSLTRATGTGSVDYRQVGISTQFGTDGSNVPRYGNNMAAMSSGRARDANDPDGTTANTYQYVTGTPPADFIAAHGGQLPTTSAGCPNGNGANDAVMLRVQLKVPSNANSFSFQFRFFSQEYWYWTCTQYNDFFIAMLDSSWLPGPGQTAIPADKNISFDSNNNYISVNTQQFFTVCPPKTGYPCPDGTAGLNGTGYTLGPGGATLWLTTTSPVVPGETITLRFVTWDTSDRALDSLVLMDNFRWSADPSDGPTTTN
jgi:Putative metal-binding motif